MSTEMSIYTFDHLIGEGSIFAEFSLGRTLGSGAFSKVVEAQDNVTGRVYAIKFSCAASAQPRVAETDCFLSRALIQMTGFFGEPAISPGVLLAKQYQDWQDVSFAGWPTLHKLIDNAGQTAAVMDLVDGTSLRQLLRRGMATKEHARLIIQTMAAMEAVGTGLKHGDLKPENIMISSTEGLAYVLDPGYFGSIEGAGPFSLQVSMTTANYYPFLEPDDMFAVGVIILEIAAGRNPLALGYAEKSAEYSIHLGVDLRDWLEASTICGKYFPAALYCLPEFLDKYKHSLSIELRDIALKCMGLRVLAEGALTFAKTFEGFARLLEEFTQMV